MPNLEINPILHDTTPAFTDKDSKEKALKAVNDLLSSLSFFRQLIPADPQRSEVCTHLSLLEHGLADLSAATGYNGMVAQEQEQRHAEIRAANLKIRELTEQMGQTMTGEAISAGLRRYENLLRAWYETAGFRYASIDFNEWNMRIDMGHEINNQHADEPHLADKAAYAAAIRSNTIPLITSDIGWDLAVDRYHSCPLDTDNNRRKIIELYAASFPGAIVTEFRTIRDGNKYLLTHKAIVPYTDIERWAKTLPIEQPDG